VRLGLTNATHEFNYWAKRLGICQRKTSLDFATVNSFSDRNF